MALFHVQDNDRPMFVRAGSYGEAERLYRAHVARENDGDAGPPPNGIAFVADEDELLLDASAAEATTDPAAAPGVGGAS